jgi:hypothetical protein
MLLLPYWVMPHIGDAFRNCGFHAMRAEDHRRSTRDRDSSDGNHGQDENCFHNILESVEVDHCLTKCLRGFLRQVGVNAAGDDALVIFARKLVAIRRAGRGVNVVRVVKEADNERKDRSDLQEHQKQLNSSSHATHPDAPDRLFPQAVTTCGAVHS